MIRLGRQLVVQALAIYEIALMAACFIAAALLTSPDVDHLSVREFFAIRIEVRNFLLLAVLVIIWNQIFSSLHLYKSRRLPERRREILDLAAAVSLASLGIAVVAHLFDIEIVTRQFLVAFWAMALGATALSRLLLRFMLRRVRLHGRNLSYVVIVGTNSRALAVAKLIESDMRLGYRLVGFVDDDWTGNEEFEASSHQIVSNLEDFPDYIRNHVVDEVYMCMPVKSFYDQSSELMLLCQQQGIIVRFGQNVFTTETERVYVENWDNQSWVTLDSGSIRGGAVLIKRMLDIIISSTLLLLLSPVMLATAIAIKLNSSGPVLFIQERIGLGKRRFRLYKFRTMTEGAEHLQGDLRSLNEADGPVFKMRNDPRITSIGSFLRRTSIDELPQLLNVLRGDMTLVGPRPLPVSDYNGFSEDWHRRRFSVRPGITCLWQVEGRSGITFDRWMELDIQYIEQWSLWLDLKILAKTVRAVLLRSGAY